MKRRQFFGTLTSGIAAGALTNAQSSSPAPANALVRTPLVLMAPRSDGIEAVWAVHKLCKGQVEWEGEDGTSGKAGTDSFGFVPQGDNVLRVRVSGLKPGAKYRIRAITTAAAGNEPEISPWKPFRTLDPASQTTEFVIWNDTHLHDETIRKLHEVTPTADFLLWNGDTCNDWTSPDLLVPTLLHPGERDISEGHPLFLIWGNHDVRGHHAYEMPSMIATPNSRPYYAFRSGPVAAICLHTGEDKPDSHPSFGGRVSFDTLRREQADWLAKIIRHPEFRDAAYRLIFCHIPLRWREERFPDYEKGGYDHFSFRSREAWHDSLVDWKAQVIISGHTHQHAWLPPNDRFPYGQMTGGGPQLQRATWIQAKADADKLTLKVHALDGEVRHEITLQPYS